LRKITALLKNEDICSFLRRAKDRNEMVALLREADEILSK
jgi:mannitol/fructose-specific phosphotransferase system IIA component (Ntr-type)